MVDGEGDCVGSGRECWRKFGRKFERPNNGAEVSVVLNRLDGDEGKLSALSANAFP